MASPASKVLASVSPSSASVAMVFGTSTAGGRGLLVLPAELNILSCFWPAKGAHSYACAQHTLLIACNFTYAAAQHFLRYVYISHVHCCLFPVHNNCHRRLWGDTKQSAPSGSRQSIRGLLCGRRARCTCDLCNLYSGTVTSVLVPAVMTASGSTSQVQPHTATQGMTSIQSWQRHLKIPQFMSAILPIDAVVRS